MDIRRYSGTVRFLFQLTRHSVGRPKPLPLEQRLAMLPVEGAPVAHPVAIHWNSRHVPFVEAETDTDLAAALGVVHGHLRLGQMELMRRLSQGRISELVGGAGLEIDRLIRTFEIGRAAPAILAMLPEETREWIAAFVGGINHVIAKSEHLPPEFGIFGLSREPWSVEDVLTLGRLVSADINWLVWLRLMKFRAGRDWGVLWRTLLRADALSAFSGDRGRDPTADALGLAAVRSGSNSFAVSARRSRSGGALIASDPHLSISLPNPWLIAGYRSPSHHAVGLMIPGIPFIAIGRSPHLAWGGASLHAASSDLVAVPPGSETIARSETVRVRGAPDRKVTIRHSEWGPLIGELRPFRRGLSGDVALRWMGHLPSDEFTAMLAIGRARDFDEVKRALAGYALPGLEMNFASASGAVAQFTAVRVPRRSEREPAGIVSASASGWDRIAGIADFPARVDPDCGIVVAANTRPDWSDPVIGFLFSPPARRDRIASLLGETNRPDADDLKRIQRDVHRTGAIAERGAILGWIAQAKLASSELVAEIAEWNGDYDANSRGALAFELVVCHLASRLVPKRKRRAYAAIWGSRELIWSEIRAAAPARRTDALRRALRSAARDFGRGATWGSRHRLRIAHPLAALPAIGRRFRYADRPAAGTSDTVMKTAHAMTNRRHGALYGSVARHVSDMADQDANWFALLGGNDGWLESATALDQLELWQEGEYIRVPLHPDTARATFPHKMVLAP